MTLTLQHLKIPRRKQRGADSKSRLLFGGTVGSMVMETLLLPLYLHCSHPSRCSSTPTEYFSAVVSLFLPLLLNACGRFSGCEQRSLLYAGGKYRSETCSFTMCPSVSCVGLYLDVMEAPACFTDVHALSSQLVFVGLGAVCSALRRRASAVHHRAGELQCVYCADD